MIPARYPLAVAVLLLAGCSGEKAAADKREAGGQVLPGSISDAMLPVDTVRSQPPLAPHSDAPRDASGKKAEAAADASPAASDAAEAAVPKPDAT